MTGLIIRSTATRWAKSSLLAVDAGTHLAAIIRILEQHQPQATRIESPEQAPSNPAPNGTPKRSRKNNSGGFGNSTPDASLHTANNPTYLGHISDSIDVQTNSPGPVVAAELSTNPKLILTTGPFSGLFLPYETPKANASYLLRNLISTYLITHPHLDHLSGFAVNTASFQHTSRPKKVAALPSTINAIKDHIFNDIIWPNLSDEEGGVGLVSYMRLVEGGNIALGNGDSQGYIELCDGLSVKARSISHGHCMNPHPHRGTSNPDVSLDLQYHNSRRTSSYATNESPLALRRGSLGHPDANIHTQDNACVIDSSAFFIRDEHTGHEVLIFGDVEPDSISLSPRTVRVWMDAAPKIAAGTLSAVLIECSYADSQSDETLFGHLAPRHLIAELSVLADEVRAIRKGSLDEDETSTSQSPGDTDARLEADFQRTRKRKRHGDGLSLLEEFRRGRTAHSKGRNARPVTHSRSSSPRTKVDSQSPARSARLSNRFNPGSSFAQREDVPTDLDPYDEADGIMTAPVVPGTATEPEDKEPRPLAGLKVIIIHVKDTLQDGPSAGEIILTQLLEREAKVHLGCDFLLSKAGADLWV